MGVSGRDDRCRCEVDPDGEPDGLVVLTGRWEGLEARFAAGPDCPGHGMLVRAVRRCALRKLSLR